MIPRKLYGEIKQVMPISCVDIILHIDNRVLLCKRRNSPAKGLWWIQGGRILKGETLEDAAIRKGKEELGIEIILERQLKTYDNIFPEVHTVTTVFIARPLKGACQIHLDSQHSDYKFVDKITPDLHPYLIEELKDSEVLK